ncbi:MAG: F0F1 ATP synthase subunit B [Leptolyngbyaceae cyanobacterium RM2_2_4]|nr:F0F1 ATP synthase subunit B [Leptolyngbyaceae cyanobacterium SM1_4_3]NJN89495.1 F0F1 ATP synthase subunit B [Leptolyngbyaceae cyanobacterium SL_5_14]NJO49910.1 F0F1 ATP synthase subunit B [Leptolyngbyaceae cyanobacterium RM2_2_4]
MGTLLFLAAEAGAIANDFSEAAEEGGFGLNFNILDTNLINLAIILGVLFYFGRGFLGKILLERREKIETAIQDAEKRKKDAAAALADQQQKLAQAQTEAGRIRAAAEESAKKAKEAILVQTEQDIQRIKAAAVQDLNSQQERVIAELRQRVVALALQQTESRLKSDLNENTQQQLIDRSIAMLGGQS